MFLKNTLMPIIGFVLLIFSPVFFIYIPNPVFSQTSETTASSPQTTGLHTIQITSVQDGQQVPPGELTLQGISSEMKKPTVRYMLM